VVSAVGKATIQRHNRQTAAGKTVGVRQHSAARKAGRGRPAKRRRGRNRGLFKPRRALKNAKKAIRAARRNKGAMALGFGTLAFLEIGGYMAGRGAGLLGAGLGFAAMGAVKLAGRSR
jgi:hypothetical protein